MKTKIFLSLSLLAIFLASTGCNKNCDCDFSNVGRLEVSFETLPPDVSDINFYISTLSNTLKIVELQIDEASKTMEAKLNKGNYTLRCHNTGTSANFQIHAKKTTYIYYPAELWDLLGR